MKIMIVDVYLKGQDNSDWKEGYEFMYAFRNLGHQADVFGPFGEFSETQIQEMSNFYDFILITENYPTPWNGINGWKWWGFENIKIPKIFWAIDTHLVNYLSWINHAKIDIVAFNNPQDMLKYNLKNSFFMPYAVSKKHHLINYATEKKRNLVFIGGLLPERKRICEKFNIEHLNAYGPNYINELQKSKICFNLSMSYDINAKYFEILSSGSFMLTNYNPHFEEFVDFNENIQKMFYKNEDELGEKIKYFLENEKEREDIANKVKDFIYKNHSWENRAELIISEFIKLKKIN
jgi:glycosyltransferase involved in cell wall biosynthesis